MYKHVVLGIVLAGSVWLSACSTGDEPKSDHGKVIARVNDKYLYEDDLKDIIPANTAPDDSTNMVRSYIENWIRQKLVLAKAELNLNPGEYDIDNLIENYRQDLLQYIYKRELVRQKLDTVVSQKDMETYYEANKEKFELQDDIVQVSYAVFDMKTPGLDKLDKWYKSSDPQDMEAYRNHCFSYASSYYLNDSSWVMVESLRKAIPILPEHISNMGYFEEQDSLRKYFVHIRSFKSKESISPFSFEKERIREILINQRKVKLLEDLEENLYQEAVRKNQIEIF
ncbi:MAG: hypothetical protein H6585_05045 [Flavobacteriales bacterium]|nr:hypothetical protein [Flavobacteriales bacterium]MCB9447695.1 hypothetical protein [Flavobacteriales bacterium]